MSPHVLCSVSFFSKNAQKSCPRTLFCVSFGCVFWWFSARSTLCVNLNTRLRFWRVSGGVAGSFLAHVFYQGSIAPSLCHASLVPYANVPISVRFKMLFLVGFSGCFGI